MCTLGVEYQYLVKNSSAHSGKRCRMKECEEGGDSRFVYAFLSLSSASFSYDGVSRDLGPVWLALPIAMDGNYWHGAIFGGPWLVWVREES